MPVATAEHKLGPLDDFTVGEIKLVEIEGREVGIVRAQDTIFEIGNRCPHQGAPLCAGRVTGTMLASDRNEYVYGEDGLVVRCPWHGFEFHVPTGESVGGAIRGRIPVYHVEVRDGEVYCSLRRPEREAE
jgi:nitrite reductase/ring-hydroxylating ferredoxin subunit